MRRIILALVGALIAAFVAVYFYSGDWRGILAMRLKSDGAFAKSLYVPSGGSKRPATSSGISPMSSTIAVLL